MEVPIPYNFIPRSYQLPLCQAMDRGVKRAVAVWHRRAGKDLTLINILVKEACERVGTYFYFFPTYKQGRMILWDGMNRDGFKFLDYIPKPIRANTNNQEMKIRLLNGSMIQVVGTDDIDKVVGTNPVGCVFSEYALQKPEAWDFVRPILRENDGFALFNYTPRGLNHGWDIYQTALQNDSWFCQLLTVHDTIRPDGSPVIARADIEKEREEGMSEAMIQQEFYCDFNASSDDVLIPLQSIQQASGKVVHPSSYMHMPRVLGVDVARFGDDSSVLIIRQGLAAYALQKFDGLDNYALAQRVAHTIKDKKIDAVHIDAGRGEGVIDILRHMGFSVVEVNFGGKPDNPRYKNKRSEMWDLTRQWLEAGGAIPDDQELRTQLSMPTYFFDTADRLQLIAKEKIKADFGVSTDMADALALTHAYPVAKKDDTLSIISRPKKAQTEYNLFGGVA